MPASLHNMALLYRKGQERKLMISGRFPENQPIPFWNPIPKVSSSQEFPQKTSAKLRNLKKE